MNHSIEREFFDEALAHAENKLAYTNLRLSEGEEHVERAELWEARDALQGLIQHAKAFLEVHNALQSDKAKEANAKKVKRLQRNLRRAKQQKRLAKQSAEHAKRKLDRLQDKLQQLKPLVYDLEWLSDEEDDGSGWGAETCGMETWGEEWKDVSFPQDSPHLMAYEALL